MDSSDWSNGIRYHKFGTRPVTEFNLGRFVPETSPEISKHFPSWYELNLSRFVDEIAREDAPRCHLSPEPHPKSPKVAVLYLGPHPKPLEGAGTELESERVSGRGGRRTRQMRCR
jgi:hypothetical protein